MQLVCAQRNALWNLVRYHFVSNKENHGDNVNFLFVVTRACKPVTSVFVTSKRRNILTLNGKQHLVWDTASRSTKRQDIAIQTGRLWVDCGYELKTSWCQICFCRKDEYMLKWIFVWKYVKRLRFQICIENLSWCKGKAQSRSTSWTLWENSGKMSEQKIRKPRSRWGALLEMKLFKRMWKTLLMLCQIHKKQQGWHLHKTKSK